MNYIINPSVFYWIRVLHGLVSISVLFLIIGCAGILIFGIIWIIWLLDEDDVEPTMIKTIFRWAIPMFVVGLLGTVFIPDKQTMMEILIAKTATVENAEWTVESLKSIVDYIVQAAQSLK